MPYEQVTETLESNRGLVEAYWRVRLLAEEAGRLGQPLSLPSHEELSLQVRILVCPMLFEPGLFMYWSPYH